MKIRSLICALALAAVAFAGNANAEMLENSELSLNPEIQTEQIETMIAIVFDPLEAKVPGIVNKMIDIADCESYGGNDGMIMHINPEGEIVANSSPRSSATGVLQVLLITHRPTYTEMGLDPIQVGDNLMFGRHLVEGRLERGQHPFADWVCA